MYKDFFNEDLSNLLQEVASWITTNDRSSEPSFKVENVIVYFSHPYWNATVYYSW